MGRPDNKCPVFIFRHTWRRRWPSDYQDVSSGKFTVLIPFQAFPQANTIFAGIGVLLLVSVLHSSVVQPALTRMTPRRLKTPVLAKTS